MKVADITCKFIDFNSPRSDCEVYSTFPKNPSHPDTQLQSRFGQKSESPLQIVLDKPVNICSLGTACCNGKWCSGVVKGFLVKCWYHQNNVSCKKAYKN